MAHFRRHLPLGPTDVVVAASLLVLATAYHAVRRVVGIVPAPG